MTEFLVTPAALDALRRDASVRIVDASWYLPRQERDGHAEFLAGHIPGAVFFDIDAIADRTSALPHMLPSEEEFAIEAGALGISERDTIVVYDGSGLFTAPRVWWTFRVFGARDVRILDGGLPAWTAAGLPLEAGEAAPKAARFDADLDTNAVADFDAVLTALDSGSSAVVDARSAVRFRGEAAEPRAGLAAGHMPGARNLPFDRLAPGGHLLPPDAIRALFRDAGVDVSAPVVTSCGSGVTAAVLLFALAVLGKDDVRLYDGSWAEWGAREGAPVARGEA